MTKARRPTHGPWADWFADHPSPRAGSLSWRLITSGRSTWAILTGPSDVRLFAALHAQLPADALGYSQHGAMLVRESSRAQAEEIIEAHRERGSSSPRWDVYAGDSLIDTVTADSPEQVRAVLVKHYGDAAAVSLRVVAVTA